MGILTTAEGNERVRIGWRTHTRPNSQREFSQDISTNKSVRNAQARCWSCRVLLSVSQVSFRDAGVAGIGLQFKVWSPRSVSQRDALKSFLLISTVSSYLRLCMSLSLLSSQTFAFLSVIRPTEKLGLLRIGPITPTTSTARTRRRNDEPTWRTPWPSSLYRFLSSFSTSDPVPAHLCSSGDWTHPTPECIEGAANTPPSTDTTPQRHMTCG